MTSACGFEAVELVPSPNKNQQDIDENFQDLVENAGKLDKILKGLLSDSALLQCQICIKLPRIILLFFSLFFQRKLYFVFWEGYREKDNLYNIKFALNGEKSSFFVFF